MHQSVDTFFDLNEGSKSGKALHFTFQDGSDGIAIFNSEPGIGIHLFHAQRDTFVLLVQFQYDGIDGVTVFEDFAGISNLFCPAHFADVDQTFHAGFQFHKSTETLHAYHFTGDTGTFRIFDFDVFPRMWYQLFQSQRYFITFRIKIDHFHFYFVAYGKHF